MKQPNEGRATCLECFKPTAMCVCAGIEPVANRTGIIVLQHPRERAHPIGTARFITLGLAKGEVHALRQVETPPIPLPPRTGVLFPRHDAQDLETLAPAERPEHLVVLDGTWPHARSIYKRNPWLEALPHYRLSPASPSRYRIRREPSPDYVSTLESVVVALSVLEPETQGLGGLLEAFDRMIDQQIARRDEARAHGLGQRRRASKANRPFVGIPTWLGERFGKLVGVYAEAPADRFGGGARRTFPPFQLVAQRFADGAFFERFVLPPEGMSDGLAEEAFRRLGVAPSELEGAIPPRQALSELQAFVGEGIPLAWSSRTPRRLWLASGETERRWFETARLLLPAKKIFERRQQKATSCGEMPSDAPQRVLRGRSAYRLWRLRAEAEALRRLALVETSD